MEVIDDTRSSLFPRQRHCGCCLGAARHLPASLCGHPDRRHRRARDACGGIRRHLVTKWAGSAGGFSSLAAIGTLFSSPWLLLAGWTHYLAFDLLVGSWEMRDARD